MTILFILPLLFNNFALKWNFPQGTYSAAGEVVIGDTDRDGNYEFMFTTYGGPHTVYIYELHLPDTWDIDSVPDLNAPILWDIGDFDVDGFYDLVMQCGSTNPFWVGMTILESPDSFSYPSQEVWRDTVGSALVTPICTYDIDQDGLLEIVKVLGDYIHLHIYESIGDNLYDKIAEITTSSTHNSSSTLAFGDFDLDNQNEFVWGYSAGEYSIWECTGNNTYQEILLQQLPTLNIKDCISVPDADSDGKMEFVVKGFVVPTGEINVFILEAIGDNTYEMIQSFDLTGGTSDYYGGHSDAGDVDGDSIPEIVLEGCARVYIIKSAGNDSFFVWDTLPGNWTGSSVRVYDVDDNGLSEVVVSGGNTTRIFEYELGITETQEAVVSQMGIQICPNPFRHTTGISYQLPYNCRANLQIYDVAGKLMREFCLKQNALRNTLFWDGSDDHNRMLPSGVYFLKLQARDYSATQKLLLIR